MFYCRCNFFFLSIPTQHRAPTDVEHALRNFQSVWISSSFGERKPCTYSQSSFCVFLLLEAISFAYLFRCFWQNIYVSKSPKAHMTYRPSLKLFRGLEKFIKDNVWIFFHFNAYIKRGFNVRSEVFVSCSCCYFLPPNPASCLFTQYSVFYVTSAMCTKFKIICLDTGIELHLMFFESSRLWTLSTTFVQRGFHFIAKLR